MEYLNWPKGIYDRDENFLSSEMIILDEFRIVSKEINCSSIKIAPVGYKCTYTRIGNTTGNKSYEFLDRSDRPLILTPDSSPSILRHYLKNSFQNNKKNYFFYSPIFRYRNRANRFYHQIGISIINGNPIYKDVDGDAFLILNQYLKAIRNIGLNVSIVLSHFGLIRKLLLNLSCRDDYDYSDNILNEIRSIPLAERKNYLISRYADNKSLSILIDLLTNDFFPLESLPNEYKEAKETISFFKLLKEHHQGDIKLSFSDLRSSEIQNGIVYKIYFNNRKIGDGGCYDYKSKNFHQKINSVKSIAAVLEDLVEYSHLKNSNDSKSVILICVDCSFHFALCVFNKIKQSQSNSSIEIIRSNSPSKVLSKFPSASYFSIINLNNEENKIFELINMENGNKHQICI